MNAFLAAVADVLPAYDVRRLNREHAAEDLVLLFADRARLEGGRRLHRYEREDLEEVSDDHVAERADTLVEARAFSEPQRFRHIDLHVVDEVAIPNGLEQTVPEPEREDILCRLFAEKVVDAKELLLVEDLVNAGVQRNRTLQIRAE